MRHQLLSSTDPSLAQRLGAQDARHVPTDTASWADSTAAMTATSVSFWFSRRVFDRLPRLDEKSTERLGRNQDPDRLPFAGGVSPYASKDAYHRKCRGLDKGAQRDHNTQIRSHSRSLSSEDLSQHRHTAWRTGHANRCLPKESPQVHGLTLTNFVWMQCAPWPNFRSTYGNALFDCRSPYIASPLEVGEDLSQPFFFPNIRNLL
jgi:hypothetical protein